MNRLKWIATAGGPLVLISDKSYKLWSGILKRSSYVENRLEEAINFMDAEETDYGRACEIQDYLGVVDIGSDFALVFGDEPMLSTVQYTTDKKIIVARWVYADSEKFVDQILQALDTAKIDNWQLSLTFEFLSDKQYLFDAASNFRMIENDTENYLTVNIAQGRYTIWTSVYEPDDKTRLLIHKFERTN